MAFPPMDASRSSTLRRNVVGSASTLSRPLPPPPSEAVLAQAARNADVMRNNAHDPNNTDKMTTLQVINSSVLFQPHCKFIIIIMNYIVCTSGEISTLSRSNASSGR